MGALEVVHRDASVALAPSENVLFVVWTGDVTEASVRALHDASLRLSREHPRGIAHMNVVATGSAGAGLDETARKRFFALIRDPGVRLVASATVLSDGGFLAATIRSVLAGLALLALPGMKLKFFSDVEQAETWLRASLTASSADAPEAGAVRRVLASLRTALGPDGARL